MRTAVALAKTDYETLKYTFEECRRRMRYIKEEDYRTLEAIVNRIKERLNKANFFEKFQIRSILKKSLRLLEKAYSNLQAGYEH